MPPRANEVSREIFNSSFISVIDYVRNDVAYMEVYYSTSSSMQGLIFRGIQSDLYLPSDELSVFQSRGSVA